MKQCSSHPPKKREVLLVILIALSATLNVNAQKFGVKIYQNTDLFSTRISNNGTTSEEWTLNFKRVSIAFDINARHNLTHEIEIFIPEISKRLEDVGFPYGYHLNSSLSAANRESNFALRYELTKKITKPEGPFSARIGLAMNPYFLHIQYTPTSEAAYPTSLKNYGVSLNIVPGFAYALSKHFQLSVSLPLKVYDIIYEIKSISDPSRPIRQQETRGYEQTFFEKVFTMRVGVAYTFGRQQSK